METIISILTRFVADAVLCCAAVAAFSLGCAVVWKWQDLAEGLKGEPKTFRAVFVAMLVAAAGDSDEDGLSNWMEYALGTLPFDRYSFDDAVDDLEWIDWGVWNASLGLWMGASGMNYTFSGQQHFGNVLRTLCWLPFLTDGVVASTLVFLRWRFYRLVKCHYLKSRRRKERQ